MKKILLLIILLIPFIVNGITYETDKYTWNDTNNNREIDQGEEICLINECFNVIGIHSNKVSMLAEHELYVGYTSINGEEVEISEDDKCYLKQNKNCTGNNSYLEFTNDTERDNEELYYYEGVQKPYLREYKRFFYNNNIDVNVRLMNETDFKDFGIDVKNNEFIPVYDMPTWVTKQSFNTGITRKKVNGLLKNETLYITTYRSLWGRIINDYIRTVYYPLRPVVEITESTFKNIITEPTEEIESSTIENNSTKDIYIEKINISSNNENILNKSSIKINNLKLDISNKFENIGDEITYEITLNNKTDKKYHISKLEKEYNYYKIVSDEYEINPKESQVIVVKVELTNKKENEIIKNNDTHNIPLELNIKEEKTIIDIINPYTKTGKEIILLFIIITILFIYFVISLKHNKKNKYTNLLLILFITLIPLTILNANEGLKIEMNFNTELGHKEIQTAYLKKNRNDAITINFEEGMTWREWIDSEYNSFEYKENGHKYLYLKDNRYKFLLIEKRLSHIHPAYAKYDVYAFNTLMISDYIIYTCGDYMTSYVNAYEYIEADVDSVIQNNENYNYRFDTAC